MAGQLLPPPELAPPIPAGLTVQRRISFWIDLMDACEQFLLAGLRRNIGAQGDLRAAFREWYAQHMLEHDETMLRMIQELNRRSNGHAG